MTWHIYTLSDPSSGEVRYVGKSQNPVRRLSLHFENPTTEEMGEWLRGLDQPPTIRILHRCELSEDADALEVAEISRHASSGSLLNVQHALADTAARTQFTGMGKRIEELRVFHGLSQADVSRLTGICGSTISHLEAGRRSQMKSDDLIRLCRCLRVTAEYLVTGESP